MTKRMCSTDECLEAVFCSGLCRRCYRRAEYQRNRQRYIERAAQWSADNRERRREIARDYARRSREADPERARERARESMKQWRERDVAAARAKNRQDYQKHREKRIAAVIRWSKENPEKFRAIQRNRELRVQGAPGDGVSAEQWTTILAIHGGRCFYCDSTDRIQMEHMVPISRGGWHDLSNVVPACASCNTRKATLRAEEFIMRLVNTDRG